MKIGSGWTKTNQTDGSTFISIALDDTVLELFPQLKNCSLILGHVKREDKKSENSPGWTVNLSCKKPKKEEAEAAALEEEIPY